MDLCSHLLSLVAPTAVGDELLPGARLAGASIELGLRLTFVVNGAELHVEVAPLEEQRPYAARSTRLSFAYRAGGTNSEVDPRMAAALCRAVAARASRREGEVLVSIARDAASAAARLEGTTRIRETHVDRLLESAGTREAPYFTLSPYVGCLIGCRFCYAQSRVGSVRRLEGLPEIPWGSYVDVRMNAAAVLAREIEELPPRPVKFCPIVSDPYQAVETRYGITRACLEVLRDARTPRAVLILTRSRLIERDAELLASIPGAYAGVSLPTVDDAARAHFEPRGASIDDRIAALGTLRRAGVRTFAIVQPLLPGSIRDLAEVLSASVASVRIDVLHGVEGAAGDFDDPRFAHAADPVWQRERADELAAALLARGVRVWPDELPPELEAKSPAH